MNSIKITSIISVTSILILLSACNDLFVDKNPNNSPIQNFNLLWHEMDEHYCYFAEKNVDWDAVGNKYRSQVNDNMSDEDLFGVMAQMVGELKDGHVNIVAPFNLARYWDWYLDYPQNFNYTNIERNYLGRDYIVSSGMKAQKLGDVGYIYYNSFMNNISDVGMDSILSKFKDCKGLILDIRNNEGGIAENMFILASRFTDSTTTVGYTKFKNGKEHDNFSTYFEEKISPSERIRFTKPIILLTNRECFSAANIFTGIIKNLSNVTIMGDTTGGGSASPLSYDLLNGWEVRISSISFTDMNKKTFEFGVAPDIIDSIKRTDEINGVDNMIDDAKFILEQQ